MCGVADDVGQLLGLAFFFLMTFFATSSDSVQIGGAIGNIDRNAPWVILRMLGIASLGE